MALGSEVGVADGRAVGVEVDIEVGVGEGSGVAVEVDRAVGVGEGSGVAVEVGKAVAVAEGTSVAVALGREVGVADGREVGVNVGLGKEVAVADGTSVAVGGIWPPPASQLYAPRTSRRPYPKLLSGPAAPRSTALLSKAAACASAVRPGKALNSKASAPATCGADNDVPLAVVYRP